MATTMVQDLVTATATATMETTMATTMVQDLVTATATETMETTAAPTDDGSNAAVDAAFVLLCTVLIFTMQTGFGLLEAGLVNRKNEVNLMFSSCTDTVVVGTVYWLLGYAFAFGDQDQKSWCRPMQHNKTFTTCSRFTGVGNFAMEELTDYPLHQGARYVNFVFQMSFASASATIVSGAVAERIKLHSYLIFITFNTFSYVFPSHWIWDGAGWLYQRGVVDIAGSGVVHLCGAAAALVCCLQLGPRKGRYANGRDSPPIGSGVNIFLGVFFLWWGWLGFNCGSVYIVSNGGWVTVAKTMTTTLLGSFGGGIVGMVYSLVKSRGKKYYVADFANGILGGLVSITAGCAVVMPWESFVIGAIGGLVANAGIPFFDLLGIDDPVGALAVHGFGGLWGMLSVGLFMHEDSVTGLNRGLRGAFWSHSGKSFGEQVIACLCIIAWSGLCSLIISTLLKGTPLGFRLTPEDEEDGADMSIHGVENSEVVKTRIIIQSQGGLPSFHSAVEVDNPKNGIKQKRKADKVGSKSVSEKTTANDEGEDTSAAYARF